MKKIKIKANRLYGYFEKRVDNTKDIDQLKNISKNSVVVVDYDHSNIIINELNINISIEFSPFIESKFYDKL